MTESPADKALTRSTLTLHFASKTLFLEQNDSIETVETVELVKPDQILATLETLPNQKDNQGSAKFELIAGVFTKLSAQGDSLLSTTAGWPQVSRTRKQQDEIVTISILPLVTINKDMMTAHLTLYPPLPNNTPLSAQELGEILYQNGIRFGLNREILQHTIEQSQRERRIITDILIAKGLYPLAGKDAYLRFEVDIGSIPGKIMGNGRIDFHERKMFIGVRKDQLIAVKVPATTGTAGTNVLGHPIPQQQGQNITVKAIDNAFFNEETGEVRATKPGVLTVTDHTIKVCSKLSISGDVNFKTGNIDANDSVDIGGSVQPGFKVKAYGDLRIGGEVRSATINSQGNIQIQGGVTGKQTTLRASGDVDIPFIEQASISAGGSVIIHKQAYYSQIIAGGDIHCEENSKILGGLMVAGGNFSAGQVGTATANPATIAAGTDGRLFLRYEALKREIQEKEDELERCLQLHGHNSQLPFHLRMTEELEEMHEELNKMNLASNKKAASPEELAFLLRSRSITIHGLVYPETLLRIGHVTYLLEKTMAACVFTLSADLQEIVAKPL